MVDVMWCCRGGVEGVGRGEGVGSELVKGVCGSCGGGCGYNGSVWLGEKTRRLGEFGLGDFVTEDWGQEGARLEVKGSQSG